MILPNKKNAFVNYDDDTGEGKKKKAQKALHDAFEQAEKGEWTAVTDLGLEFPGIMEEVINRYYDTMPDRIRYILPVKWYMASGKASEAVCNAVKNAGKYKPVLWLGKGQVKSDKVNIFCCIKAGDKEQAKACLSWATDYNTAYLKAMKISGKVFEGYINKENMIAFDESSAEPVIQYKAVYAVQQLFPRIPLSACK